MPQRRASASAGPGANARANAQPPLQHRSHDSHHHIPAVAQPIHHTQQQQLQPSQSQTQPPQSNSNANASPAQNAPPIASPQQRVVTVLVNRLRSKLPYHSGLSLQTLESDDAVHQAINSLVDLSADSLDIIALALTELLDKLAKQSDGGRFSIDVLQSQLFVLKVLTVVMSARWRSPDFAAALSTTASSTLRSSSRNSTAGGHSGLSTPVEAASPSWRGHSSANGHPSVGLSSVTAANGGQWQEPPALDDHCAKYILSVMVLFLRQTAPPDGETDILGSSDGADMLYDAHEGVRPSPPFNANRGYANGSLGAETAQQRQIRAQASATSFGSGNKAPTPIPLPRHSMSYEQTPEALCKSLLSLNVLVGKTAGHIVYHLSASNWNVVFSKIRQKIHHLASTTDSNPDLIDLQLMTHSAIDRSRLVQILQEMSSLLLNMKRQAQCLVAGPLRAAVWNWIDLFPSEYHDALRSSRRLEGAPERVFDHFWQISDSGDKRILWPTLAMLLCISAERLRPDLHISLGGGALKGGVKKESAFMEAVLKNLAPASKMHEVALRSVLDMCKAAAKIREGADSPLRSVAYDLAHDVRGVLMQHGGQRPFWDSSEEINVSLISDSLVVIYRFLPTEALDLFLACLEPERSEAVKICAVTACYALIEDATVPLSPDQSRALQETLAPRIRLIYHSCVTRHSEVDQHGNIKRCASRPKVQRLLNDPMSDRDSLLLSIMSLWRVSISFYFTALRTPSTTAPSVAHKIWDSAADIAIKINTARSVRRLMTFVFGMQPGDEFFDVAVPWMAKFAPTMLVALANNLVMTRVDFDSQKMWISAIYEILQLYVQESNQPHVLQIQRAPDRAAAFSMVEIAAIISLTSADAQVTNLAAQCLRTLALAERREGSPINPKFSQEERAEALPVYEELGDPKNVIVGRVGNHKRIRKLIRSIAKPHPAHMAVWTECYFRWTLLTEISMREGGWDPNNAGGENGAAVTVIEKSLSREEILFQWRILAHFMAAFGSACGSESERDNATPTALEHFIPAHYLPDGMRVLKDRHELAETFIMTMVDLILSESIYVRDTARDALGSELSPVLQPMLFKHMSGVVQQVAEGEHLEWDDSSWLFLEQFMGVLKLFASNKDTRAEDVLLPDAIATTLSVGSIISKLTEPGAWRIRIAYCSIVDVGTERMTELSVGADTTILEQACHDVLDIITEWIHDPQEEAEPDATKNQREVNATALRAIVRTLAYLPFKPQDDAAAEESSHNSNRLFVRYSTVLIRALDYNRSEAVLGDTASEASSHSLRARVSHRDAEVRELVITGMSYLMSGNAETGFRQGLAMAYDTDMAKRAIVIHVFARALTQGTKLEAKDTAMDAVRRSRLCELVKGSDMHCALAICKTCPSAEFDIMIPVLFNLFDTRASLMKLLKTMIDREVTDTDHEAELFRSNSMCTRLLSAFGRIHGYAYLRKLIQPLVQNMTSKPPGWSYEMDPTKVGPLEAAKNQENVEVVAGAFLKIIANSVPGLPSMFREICAHIAKTVNEVWPDAKFAALGSFIFLRFISPAIVSPDIVDVEVPKDDGGVIRRGLMVIAKIIQNLANNIFFGKEQHMVTMNNFLHANIVNVTRYLSEVNKYSVGSAEDDAEEWLGTTYDDTDTIVLHRFFEKNADKIGKELLSTSKPITDTDPSVITGKMAWDDLCGMLVDLGPPLDVPRLSMSQSWDHKEFKELTSRAAHRSTDPVNNLFVPVPTPEDSPAFFVFSVSAIDIEALDVDLLMCHVLKTLLSPAYAERDFEIICDFTSFGSSSEVPVQWLKYCTEIIPADVRQRFSGAHMLNPNALAIKYLRRVHNIFAGIPLFQDVKAYPSVTDLLRSEEVPENCDQILSPAASLEQEESHEYHEVTLRHNYQMRTPVVMSVGTTHIRLTSIKAQPVTPQMTCKSTEIVPLTDVSDVYNVSTGHDANEFIIRRRQGVTLYLSCPAREAIIKSVRDAKARLRHPPILKADRQSRLSNIIATLIHVALLSISYDDDTLRSAAYELLSAVCVHINFDETPVTSSKAGFIPGHPRTFAIQLSEKLATFSPNLTIDFISEVCAGIDKVPVPQRIHCLQYMSHWIKNLAHFQNPASPHYEHSGAKFRDSLRLLVEITVSDHELYPMVQKYVWAEIGKLDSSVVNLVLDELVRAAVDSGVESHRCGIVADTLATLSSIGVRGRIFSKLRKVLGKTSMKPTKSLADNVHWGEIATLSRLALVAGSQFKQPAQVQLYIPEIFHLVTLIAATGEARVRISIYGIVMNLLQTMQQHVPEDVPRLAIKSLVDECCHEDTLGLFGLARYTPTSEYTSLDHSSDKLAMEAQERLTRFLVRAMDALATTRGLQNVWRARWMSLVTSTAFQLSPAIQARAFVVLGILATTDVDDDLLYQMLVAFRTALSQSTEADTSAPVRMLRCMCNVVPGLLENSRYLGQMFWLAVALLQSSHTPFYTEAAQLLCATLDTMERQCAFDGRHVASVLLDARGPIEDIASQLDQMLGLSFDASFTFSLASTIFKGVRVPGLQEIAEHALRTLLRVTIAANKEPPSPMAPLNQDVLGYFLALLPSATSITAYRDLLQDCNVDPVWITEDTDFEAEGGVPRVPIELLGLQDPSTALLVTSFVGSMLATAQGDDAETQILYNVLSDVAITYPEPVSLTFESIQGRMNNTFQNSSNPKLLQAASDVFRVVVQDPNRAPNGRSSQSALNAVEENGSIGPGKDQILALEDLNMQGLAHSFQFLPANKGHATKVINWIPELVTRIIE